MKLIISTLILFLSNCVVACSPGFGPLELKPIGSTLWVTIKADIPGDGRSESVFIYWQECGQRMKRTLVEFNDAHITYTPHSELMDCYTTVNKNIPIHLHHGRPNVIELWYRKWYASGRIIVSINKKGKYRANWHALQHGVLEYL